jgi:flagellar motor protein MotB
MDGQIIRQSASYRQGLVLGLTMAEIMLLLVFCLLIAMATFLKVEHAKRQQAEERLRQAQFAGGADRELVEAIKNDPRLSELLNGAMGANDKTKVDEFWRELVEGRSTVSAAKQAGLSATELRDRLADFKALKDKGITVDKAVRNAAVMAAVDKVLARSVPATPEEIAKIVERGLGSQQVGSGHKWPPIINLSEAGGYFFRTGSAELSPAFREALLDSTPRRIAEYIKEFDVDVIEVVGHTDERPLGGGPSNLDRDLPPVLNGTSTIGTLLPADNAGLGLARAVSVVTVLRQSKLLAGLKVLPLSGAQLINTDETLAVSGTPGDIKERRRIEIRLRKATPHDSSVRAPTAAPPPVPPPVPLRRPPPRVAVPAAVPVPPNSTGLPTLRFEPRFLDATPPY